MKNVLLKIYGLLIEPISIDDDGRRREFIVNVLLAGSFLLSVAALLLVLRAFMAGGEGYTGESPLAASMVVMLFFALWVISRRGHYLVPAYTLVALFLALAFYSLSTWGILLPQGVLILALVVVMASIVLGTRVGAFVTLITGLGLVGLAALQQSGTLFFDSSWMVSPGGVVDAVAFFVTLGIITLVSWLSNREIERSLQRAIKSEGELKQERDFLEEKVIERTKELELAQREKIMELSRFAEFGRLTSGVIHELVTPLTTVALNLEQMHDEAHSEKLRRAIESTKRMERYIEAARRQLKNQSEYMEFSLDKEIQAAIDFLTPQAQKHSVKLNYIKLDDPVLDGNPIKFHQLVTNLIANGIGAYSQNMDKKKLRVAVEMWEVNDYVQVTVQDWGVGIPPQFLTKVFDPFFTLKKTDQGMGIGLSLCKEIVEEEFGGTIEVVSSTENGTIFTVRIPLKQKPRRESSE